MKRGQHALHERRIVHQHGHAVVKLEFRAAARALSNTLDDPAHAPLDLFLHGVIKCPDCAPELGLIGDDVDAYASVDLCLAKMLSAANEGCS